VGRALVGAILMLIGLAGGGSGLVIIGLLMYADGHGVPQDYVEAVTWYRKAAEKGNATAQHNLGGMYVQGRGVTQDYMLAYMWLNLAASKLSGTDRESAVKRRDLAAGKLTPEQFVLAQRMAREWKPTTPEGK